MQLRSPAHSRTLDIPSHVFITQGVLMIRRRFVTGAIALATATAIAASGTANAQEIGTPEKIGNVPSSSDAFMQGVHGLSSNDPIERESAPNKFYLSVLAAAYHGILEPLYFATLSLQPHAN